VRPYLYEHVVSFEETNALGNVYFSNFLKWQGVCRERFLKEHAPELIAHFSNGIKIATLECSCRYYWELYPFDTITVEMSLEDPQDRPGPSEQDVLRLFFKYWKTTGQQRNLVAEGGQKIAFLYARAPGSWERGHLPDSLKTALIPFGLPAV
jgi:enediyne core biosynthesis thioesterase